MSGQDPAQTLCTCSDISCRLLVLYQAHNLMGAVETSLSQLFSISGVCRPCWVRTSMFPAMSTCKVFLKSVDDENDSLIPSHDDILDPDHRESPLKLLTECQNHFRQSARLYTQRYLPMRLNLKVCDPLRGLYALARLRTRSK